jgi:hypothetical protein
MIGHAILYIILPLAVAWLAGASAYCPPYPTRKTKPEIVPEVRVFLARQSEPDAATERLMVPGVRGNALMDGVEPSGWRRMIYHPAPSLEPIRGI